jgi:hypothetical protein
MYLKKMTNSGGGAYARKGLTSREIVASRHKVSSWPDGSTSPGNYGWVFVYYTDTIQCFAERSCLLLACIQTAVLLCSLCNTLKKSIQWL